MVPDGTGNAPLLQAAGHASATGSGSSQQSEQARIKQLEDEVRRLSTLLQSKEVENSQLHARIQLSPGGAEGKMKEGSRGGTWARGAPGKTEKGAAKTTEAVAGKANRKRKRDSVDAEGPEGGAKMEGGVKKTGRGRPKGTFKLCEHKLRKTICPECKPANAPKPPREHAVVECEHKIPKRTCKVCTPPRKRQAKKCEHGKKVSLCKECGGSGLCEHNKPRYRCLLCGGNSICEHNRVRCECMECRSKKLCKHNIPRQTCPECKS